MTAKRLRDAIAQQAINLDDDGLESCKACGGGEEHYNQGVPHKNNCAIYRILFALYAIEGEEES